MKISRVSMAALATATLLAVAGTANAASLVFGVGSDKFRFNNYENIFDASGNQIPSTVTVGADGTTLSGTAASAAPGDIIVGVLNLTAATGGAGDNLSTPVTGVFALAINQIVPIGTTILPGQTVLGLTNNTSTTVVLADNYVSYTALTAAQAALTFTANDPTENPGDHSTISLAGLGFGGASQEMFTFFQNAGFNSTTAPTGTLASSFAQYISTPANHYFSLGLTSTGGNSTGYFYSDVTTAGGPSPVVESYAGLNFIGTTPDGAVVSPTFNPDKGNILDNVAISPRTDLTLENNITDNNFPLPATPGPYLRAPWDFQSNDPANVNVTTNVPVPAAAWTGLSMLAAMGGIAALRRRKQLARA